MTASTAVEISADHLNCRVSGTRCCDHLVRLTESRAEVRDASGLTPIANGYQHSRAHDYDEVFDL